MQANLIHEDQYESKSTVRRIRRNNSGKIRTDTALHHPRDPRLRRRAR